MRHFVFGLLLWMGPALAVGADPATPEFESLPVPRMDGGRPLMEVLRDRKSTRELSADPVSREQLANLLWAGFGVNRPQTGQRTAPCTMNLRSIDIYVATAEGAYRYDAEAHRLVVVSRKDVRTLTGGQDYVKVAPVALLYVADHARLATKVEQPAERSMYAAVDAGLIGENAYLYCASEGLGCVIHMPGDRAALSQALGLRPDQQIVLAHSVGHPAK
jgi:SagB-type dehydrogenase family enzyme